MGISVGYRPSDQATGIATINGALELGVTFFDAAEVYGWGANEQAVDRPWQMCATKSSSPPSSASHPRCRSKTSPARSRSSSPPGVKYFGLSEAGPQTIRAAHAVRPVSVLQTEYSLFERDVEALLPVLPELGIGLVPSSPLGRGFLTGTAKPAGSYDATGARNGDPR